MDWIFAAIMLAVFVMSAVRLWRLLQQRRLPPLTARLVTFERHEESSHDGVYWWTDARVAYVDPHGREREATVVLDGHPRPQFGQDVQLVLDPDRPGQPEQRVTLSSLEFLVAALGLVVPVLTAVLLLLPLVLDTGL